MRPVENLAVPVWRLLLGLFLSALTCAVVMGFALTLHPLLDLQTFAFPTSAFLLSVTLGQVISFPTALTLGFLLQAILRRTGKHAYAHYALAGGLGSLLPLPFWLHFISSGLFVGNFLLEIFVWLVPFAISGLAVATIFWLIAIRPATKPVPVQELEEIFS